MNKLIEHNEFCNILFLQANKGTFIVFQIVFTFMYIIRQAVVSFLKHRKYTVNIISYI